jgi:hypothetical protein
MLRPERPLAVLMSHLRKIKRTLAAMGRFQEMPSLGVDRDKEGEGSRFMRVLEGSSECIRSDA